MRTILFIIFAIISFVFLNSLQKERENLEVNLKEIDPQIISNLLLLHNVERSRLELQEFELDYELCSYAQKHAEWMAKKNSLTHSDLRKVKNFFITGENIAWNYSNEEEAINAWMNSTGHRKNILNLKFSKAGFGIAKNSKNQTYWCAVFGG